MNKIISKIQSRNNHSIFIAGSSIFLAIMSIIWGVSYASTAPSNPTNLQQTNLQQITSPATYFNAISLSWNYNVDTTTNNINPNYFIVERKDSGSNYAELKNRPFFYVQDIYNYTDSENIISGILYDYRVKACSEIKTDVLSSGGVTNGVTSSCSGYNELKGAVVRTPNTTTATPIAPANLILTNTGTDTSPSVGLSWTDNSNNETKFIIERRSSADTSNIVPFDFTSTTTSSTASTVTTSDSRDIVRGVNYYYQVKACVISNVYTNTTVSGTAPYICSTLSTATTITIPVLDTVITVSAPTNLELSSNLSSTSVSIPLKWNDNSNNVSQFVIERKLSTAIAYPTTVLGHVGAETTTYIDTAVNPGISYDYRVKACAATAITPDVPNCSDYVVLSKVIIPTPTPTPTLIVDTIAVAAPTKLVLSSNISSSSVYIPLKWSDNSNNETQFVLERKLSSETSYSPMIHYLNSNINYFTDTAVTKGASYDYRVKACVASLTAGAAPICSNYAELSKVIIPTPVVVPATPVDTTIAPVDIKTETVDIKTETVETKTTLTTTKEKLAPATVTPEKILQTITKLTPEVVTSPPPTPAAEVASKIEDISLIVDGIKNSVVNTKKELINIVNSTVLNIITRSEKSGKKIDTAKIYSYRDGIINKIDSSLLSLTVITSLDVNNLKIEVNNGIEYIKTIAGESDKITQVDSANLNNITKVINNLSSVVIEKSIAIKENGGDLLYKDTNNDGVSNYDSVYVYNIDPVKPSPVSIFEGRNINAAEKILLGFDPSSPKLIKINLEQPAASTAAVIPTYKVKEVKLTDKKEIIIGGQALPNSFITLYIYSTPIMVTVKTDSNGEWQYVLDKELENGNHTVYAATVNNTGNIVAKSSGFLFTKTAEAITFQDLPIAEASINIEKPGLLGGVNLYLAITAFFAIVIIVLVLTGVISKRTVKAE